MFQSGKLIKTGELSTETVDDVVKSLKERRFTGYVAFTVKASNGMEDSSVAFINGEIKGAFFECFKTKEKLAGETALSKINRYVNQQGVYDVVSLSGEQITMAIGVRPESQVAQAAQNEELTKLDSQEEILKKYGLASLAH
ncbi:MAG: DUF2226 domain-containing protein [Candidatus Micrarchaeota archaeon]|nr:DUF2226 domain-containing protein [Candidatus Micrarchaeota archaeon]